MEIPEHIFYFKYRKPNQNNKREDIRSARPMRRTRRVREQIINSKRIPTWKTSHSKI